MLPTEAGAAGAPQVNGSPSGTASDPGTRGSDEPTGRRAVRFLNGVVDAKRVYLCPVDPVAGEPVTAALPWPRAGLEFGASALLPEREPDAHEGSAWHLVAVLEPLPDDMSCGEAAAWAARRAVADAGALQSDAGDASVVGQRPSVDGPGSGEAGTPRPGLDATVSESNDAGVVGTRFDASSARLSDVLDSPLPDAASPDAASDAGPRLAAVTVPALRMVPFAAFSAQSLQPELSSLLVASGCVGGFGGAPDDVCGAAFESRRTSLLPAFVHLSRVTRFSVLGLQFLNASTLEAATLRSDPTSAESASGVYFTLASDVRIGQIAPSRLSTGVAREDVGEPLSDVVLTVDEPSRGDSVLVTDWQRVLDGWGTDELSNGSGWSFVLVGSPVGDDRQFNGLRLLLLPNDPLL